MTPQSSSAQSSSAQVARQLQELLSSPQSDERADAARLDEVRRLLSAQDWTPSTVNRIQHWQALLHSQLDRCVSQLSASLHRPASLRTFWGLLAAVPDHSAKNRYPHVSLKLLQALYQSLPHGVLEQSKTIRTMLQAEFIHSYIDLQYYTYIALANLAQTNCHSEDKAHLLFGILTLLPRNVTQHDLDQGRYLFAPPTLGEMQDEEDHEEDTEKHDEEENSHDNDDDEDEDEDESTSDTDQSTSPPPKKRKLHNTTFQYQLLSGHCRVMERAWMAILKLPQLPSSDLKMALQVLPESILPHVPHPLVFADFFCRAYDSGGMTAMLALDGLFLLMTQHGLEYTHFYTSLYKLLKPSLFYHKHRIRFLELLTKSLTRNPLLPCHVVAAFMKRLLRISLVCPPAACLTTLALVSNLLRLHPECASLVHCNNNDDNMMMQDRFNADTDDPTQARALESSLWELHVLEQHYYPAVATLAHSMGRDEQGPLHNIEDDFVRLSYKSLLDQERKRLEKKRKKVPLTFSKPKGLFVETSVLDGIFNVPVAGYTNEK